MRKAVWLTTARGKSKAALAALADRRPAQWPRRLHLLRRIHEAGRRFAMTSCHGKRSSGRRDDRLSLVPSALLQNHDFSAILSALRGLTLGTALALRTAGR